MEQKDIGFASYGLNVTVQQRLGVPAIVLYCVLHSAALEALKIRYWFYLIHIKAASDSSKRHGTLSYPTGRLSTRFIGGGEEYLG